MKSNFFSGAVFVSIALSGCAKTQNDYVREMRKDQSSASSIYKTYRQKTRPFAVLYGDVRGRWLDQHASSAFPGKAAHQELPPWIVERAGFIQMDEENQRLYLMVRFCQIQGGDAEKSGQLSELVSIYGEKYGTAGLMESISRMDKKALQRFVRNLGNSEEEFFKTAENFCR